MPEVIGKIRDDTQKEIKIDELTVVVPKLDEVMAQESAIERKLIELKDQAEEMLEAMDEHREELFERDILGRLAALEEKEEPELSMAAKIGMVLGVGCALAFTIDTLMNPKSLIGSLIKNGSR